MYRSLLVGFMYCTCIQLCDLEVIYGFCVNSSGIMASMYDLNVLYSGELLTEEIFVNFDVLWLFVNFWGAVFVGGTSEQST